MEANNGSAAGGFEAVATGFGEACGGGGGAGGELGNGMGTPDPCSRRAGLDSLLECGGTDGRGLEAITGGIAIFAIWSSA